MNGRLPTLLIRLEQTLEVFQRAGQERLKAPSSGKGKIWRHPENFIRVLSDDEIAEVDAALKARISRLLKCEERG